MDKDCLVYDDDESTLSTETEEQPEELEEGELPAEEGELPAEDDELLSAEMEDISVHRREHSYVVVAITGSGMTVADMSKALSVDSGDIWQILQMMWFVVDSKKHVLAANARTRAWLNRYVSLSHGVVRKSGRTRCPKCGANDCHRWDASSALSESLGVKVVTAPHTAGRGPEIFVYRNCYMVFAVNDDGMTLTDMSASVSFDTKDPREVLRHLTTIVRDCNAHVVAANRRTKWWLNHHSNVSYTTVRMRSKSHCPECKTTDCHRWDASSALSECLGVEFNARDYTKVCDEEKNGGTKVIGRILM